MKISVLLLGSIILLKPAFGADLKQTALNADCGTGLSMATGNGLKISGDGKLVVDTTKGIGTNGNDVYTYKGVTVRITKTSTGVVSKVEISPNLSQVKKSGLAELTPLEVSDFKNATYVKQEFNIGTSPKGCYLTDEIVSIGDGKKLKKYVTYASDICEKVVKYMKSGGFYHGVYTWVINGTRTEHSSQVTHGTTSVTTTVNQSAYAPSAEFLMVKNAKEKSVDIFHAQFRYSDDPKVIQKNTDAATKDAQEIILACEAKAPLNFYPALTQEAIRDQEKAREESDRSGIAR